VAVGTEIHQEMIWSGTLTCVDSLAIKAHTSDGRTFSSPVCMAVAPLKAAKAPNWAEDHVLVTPEAQEQLCATEIWYHLGGWYDEGDSYDTQEFQFQEELDRFWMRLVGPDEHRRRQIASAIEGIKPDWSTIEVTPDGTVHIRFTDGSDRSLTPPTATVPRAVD